MSARVASYSNVSIDLMKDEAYVSSSSHTAKSSEHHLHRQPLRVGNNKGLIGLNQNGEDSGCVQPAGLHEATGMASLSSIKNFNPASKASFAERCRKLMASYDTTLSDCDDEITHSSEPSDISPLLPRSPTELLGDCGQLKPPTEILGDKGQLRPPTELLGYDGKRRRPAKLLGYDGQTSRAAEFFEDDGQLKSPAELLGYDGKKRYLAGYDGKKDYRTELLGGDIRDGRKGRPPSGTWAKVKKRNAVNSKKASPRTIGISRISNGERANKNDVFGSSTTEQALPSPTSGAPKQSKFTRGSLEIEVNIPPMIHH